MSETLKILEVPEADAEKQEVKAEVHSVQDGECAPEAKIEPAKEEEDSPLLKMIKTLRARQKAAAPKIKVNDPSFSIKYGLSGLDEEDELLSMAECIDAVHRLSTEQPKDKEKRPIALDQIIQKGDECPCPKHSMLRVAAIMVKYGWVGWA